MWAGVQAGTRRQASKQASKRLQTLHKQNFKHELNYKPQIKLRKEIVQDGLTEDGQRALCSPDQRSPCSDDVSETLRRNKSLHVLASHRAVEILPPEIDLPPSSPPTPYGAALPSYGRDDRPLGEVEEGGMEDDGAACSAAHTTTDIGSVILEKEMMMR